MSDHTSSFTYQQLKDRVCLVTGASRTLGAVIARSAAAHGAHVAVNYHQSEAEAQELCRQLRVEGGNATPYKADVSQPEQVEWLVEQTWRQLGPIDILVNNVGPYVDTPFLQLPLADFDRILAGNVRATFLLSQIAGRRMKQRGSGHIINIAATDFLHRSHSVYGLAKSGVIYLTQALALELAPEVQVNAVAPDLIADNEGMSEGLVGQAIEGTPLGRLVRRNEIAEMVCQLCTPLFASMTGQTLILDGGRSLPRIALGKQAKQVE
jgi:NAD(P)-dependent dehydrogenase (short-subunit alcohol dehydrogenase family)